MAKFSKKGKVKRKVRKPAGCKMGVCKPKKVKTKTKDILPRGKNKPAKKVKAKAPKEEQMVGFQVKRITELDPASKKRVKEQSKSTKANGRKYA